MKKFLPRNIFVISPIMVNLKKNQIYSAKVNCKNNQQNCNNKLTIWSQQK